MSTDIYKFLAVNCTLKNYSNAIVLFNVSLLIPPSMSNVQQGFPSESNLHRSMHTCIDGLEKLNDNMLKEFQISK